MNCSSKLPGRVAGIDFGTVRIGIALSDPGRSIASPLETYVRRNPELDAQRFRRLVEEEGVTLFVVGLPVSLDGNESNLSAAAREFGQWLTEITGVAVDFFDERFTSAQAKYLLLDAGMTDKDRKKRIDMLAAQIMLSAYLESHGHGQQHPGPLDDNP
ncbi:MAG TPA: Holliday junction resolvase RuvX [Thermoguttaceae bacterium]